LSYIAKSFPKTFRKIEKNSPQKKTVEAILPKAHPILVKPILQTSVFVLGEILPNLELKNIISTYTKNFPEKNWPKFARFPKRKFPNRERSGTCA